MGKLKEVFTLDALGQADLIRRKEVTPLELVDEVIDNIERLNPALNAVVIPMFEIARKAAQESIPDGPFAGVPFLLKDLTAEYKGAPYTGGSAFLKGYISPRDTELVRRYKRAGLVTLGKTNSPEFGVGPVTQPRLYGPSRNPWNTGRTPGGSSGGSGAAVAAGLVAIAHSSDGGGSLRIPASCCGLVGLKPTRARNPAGPNYGELLGGLAAEHVLTRSVRDSAAALDATSGPDMGDPYWAPPADRPFLQAVKEPPGRLRIAFTDQSPLGTEVHPDCQAAVRDVAKLCEELGHHVEESSPQVNGSLLFDNFTSVLAAGTAFEILNSSRILGRKPTADDFEPLAWGVAERGNQMSASQYLLAVNYLQKLSRDVAHFFDSYDVLLTPTLGMPPVPIGSFLMGEDDDPIETRREMARFTPFTSLQNVTGQPALSLPLSWNSSGLPIGAHFVGRFGDELTLFRLAGQLEETRPWKDRWPKVSIFN
ncbi:amidase [Peribacillus saganii]|uniref:Amidase n=1 Tax=Peribacillus saganii TaxID=2303992 RepID=A0A372LM82_9BACI|nr:amidase [Peribacillus saganii]